MSDWLLFHWMTGLAFTDYLFYGGLYVVGSLVTAVALGKWFKHCGKND